MKRDWLVLDQGAVFVPMCKIVGFDGAAHPDDYAIIHKGPRYYMTIPSWVAADLNRAQFRMIDGGKR